MKKLLSLIAVVTFLEAPAQNVGIGTTTPVEKLQVTGNIGNNGKAVFGKIN